jgi:hypothetical protein
MPKGYTAKPERNSAHNAKRENHKRKKAMARPVCTENLNPDVMVMKSAKDRA